MQRKAWYESAMLLKAFDKLAGSQLLVVAFPKDLTPCCEREQRAFAVKLRHLTGLGVRVIAVSATRSNAHEQFAARFGLEYPLVHDPDYALLSELGWVAVKTYRGRSYRHVARAAALFVAGELAKTFEPFDLEHEVLRVLPFVSAGSARG